MNGGGEGVGLKKAFSRFSDCEDGKTSLTPLSEWLIQASLKIF